MHQDILPRNECIEDTHHLMQLARNTGQVRAELEIRIATLGLFVLMGGLKYNWLLDPKAFDLDVVARQTFETHLTSPTLSHLDL